MDETFVGADSVAEADLIEYDEAGVDISLIRWWLSLSALEKLEIRDQRDRDVAAIRELNAQR